ncbi:MAG: hypothetical protein AAFV49_04520 [Pseudomonadota bacterium]
MSVADAQTESEQSHPILRATLFGAFEIRTLDGVDLTPPGSAKAQAIIAMILLAPNNTVSRQKLMTTLWSDRQSEQAMSSLRTELHVIRRSLGEHRELLISSPQGITFRPGAVQCDVHKTDFAMRGDAQLLDTPSVRDPQYRRWLEAQRQALLDRVLRPLRPVVWVRAPDPSAPLHSDIVTSGISQGLTDWCAQQITASGPDLPDFEVDDPAPASRFVLETRASATQENIALHLRLLRERGRAQIWQRTDMLPTDLARLLAEERAHRLINQSVDRTLYEIAPPGETSREARYLDRGTLGAVRLIFRNQGDDLDRARRQLAFNDEMRPRGLYAAWSAYVLTFFKAERNVAHEDVHDEAEALVHRALELEPHNAMVLALCSYVFTYLLERPEVGVEMASRSIEVNPSNPLAWSFRSAAHSWLGDPERAFQDADRGRRISGDGPYRYAVESFFCIAATMSNRVEEAIRAGEMASALKPDFRVSMRYLSLLYQHTGNEVRLSETIGRLRRVERDFSVRKMLEGGNYPSELLRRAPLAGSRPRALAAQETRESHPTEPGSTRLRS